MHGDVTCGWKCTRGIHELSCCVLDVFLFALYTDWFLSIRDNRCVFFKGMSPRKTYPRNDTPQVSFYTPDGLDSSRPTLVILVLTTLCVSYLLVVTLFQGSSNPGPADVEPMEEEKREDEGDDEKEVGDEEDDDAAMEEENRRAEGADEPPAFGVEGEGGDSAVLEAAKEEVRRAACSCVSYTVNAMC